MMELKEVNVDYRRRAVVCTYNVKHSTHEGDGATLSQPLILYVNEGAVFCSLGIEKCEGKTIEESLGRMARWLRRLADGIEQRKTIELPF